jgi:GlpG protein
MRIIGYLENETSARTFSDYLYVQGIENQLEAEKDGKWAVWVQDEGEIKRAKDLLTSYHHYPSDPKFVNEAKAAAKLRERAEQEKAAYEKKVYGRGEVFRRLTSYGVGPLSVLLIAISVAVFLLSRFGTDPRPIRGLFITENFVFGGPLERLSGLSEIGQGQIWRLFTPMFIHYGMLHILFNMLWLHDLGSMIEARQSTWKLAFLVFAIAAVSNLAQYIVSGPKFGGMSGVVYGLLGYVWMRGKFDPGSGLFLHPSTVTMMIVWFFICFTGLVGPVANTVHAAGLVMGIAWGYFSSFGGR